MENLVKNSSGRGIERRKDDVGTESFTESSTESRRSSWSKSSSEMSSEDVKAKGCSSPSWSVKKVEISKESESEQKPRSNFEKLSGRKGSEIDMMKERFAKLLLGEDMSGSGKGVSTALAISNAITNLCATIFGQLWRLEPVPAERKAMWQREMEYLLCVSDHIVELIPSCQTFPDGSKMEVMTCRARSDIFINLPALRKLDNMLLEILDSFTDTEFWYVDQGVVAPEADDGSASFRKAMQRQEEKWWLPVPRVPHGGLSENSRRQLHHTRECTSQILKAAMAINSTTLSEMEVPGSYLEALPKNGRACLGDVIYRYITTDHFSAECLLDCLDLSSEHVALEIANRVEASIYVWRRRSHQKPPTYPNRSTTKSSWEMVKDLMVDGDKREVLAERAEGLLQCLKQRFPSLSQTALDTTKIQCNKDVGKSILESYSRVLESLAFNIVARIDDLIYVDDLSKTTNKLSPLRTVNVVAQKRVMFPYSLPGASTPYRTASTTPSFSPLPLVSPARGERTPFLRNNDKPQRRGLGVKRVLTNYLGGDPKSKVCGNSMDGEPCLISSRHGNEGFEHHRDLSSPKRVQGTTK